MIARENAIRHDLTLTEDDDGWCIPTCLCGWIGPPCPDNEIAAEFYTDHRLLEARGG